MAARWSASSFSSPWAARTRPSEDSRSALLVCGTRWTSPPSSQDRSSADRPGAAWFDIVAFSLLKKSLRWFRPGGLRPETLPSDQECDHGPAHPASDQRGWIHEVVARGAPGGGASAETGAD